MAASTVASVVGGGESAGRAATGRFVAASAKVLGGSFVAVGVLGLLAFAVAALIGKMDVARSGQALLAAGALFMTGAGTYASGELLSVLPDIRSDTWRTTKLLEQLTKNGQPGGFAQ
jgi:hypothetical protein